MKEKLNLLKKEIQKQVIGHEGVIDALLIALLSDGHILLEGVPGLAKTTVIKAIAAAVTLTFKRIQFTPDLLPSDIIGAEIYNMHSATFNIKHGPLFTNLLLADEINRAPAKVQSALLEVMQEKQITIGEKSFQLQEPFFVLATQNPIEQEGTFPLPEAELDRFMFKIIVGYNTEEEELAIAHKVANASFEKIEAVLSVKELLKMKESVKSIHIDEVLEAYIIKLIFATRKSQKYLAFGASPRASIDLIKASKARAYLRGKEYVSPSDIILCVKDVLRHRVVLSYEAVLNNVNVDTVLQEIIEMVPVP